LKIALDEFSSATDTSLALQCMLLSSTFFYSMATGAGGPNKKVFLFEFIHDHKIWQELDFWERTIICKFLKKLTIIRASAVGNNRTDISFG